MFVLSSCNLYSYLLMVRLVDFHSQSNWLGLGKIGDGLMEMHQNGDDDANRDGNGDCDVDVHVHVDVDVDIDVDVVERIESRG